MGTCLMKHGGRYLKVTKISLGMAVTPQNIKRARPVAIFALPLCQQLILSVSPASCLDRLFVYVCGHRHPRVVPLE